MAMTPLTLLFVGLLATLSTIGMLIEMDPTTDLLMPFVATLLWGVTGLSAFSVTIGATNLVEPVTRSITPVAYLGLGFAAITFMFGVYQLIHKPTEELDESDLDLGGGGR